MIVQQKYDSLLWDVNDDTSETSYHIEKIKTKRQLPNSFDLVTRNEVTVFYVYAKPHDNKDKTE